MTNHKKEQSLTEFVYHSEKTDKKEDKKISAELFAQRFKSRLIEIKQQLKGDSKKSLLQVILIFLSFTFLIALGTLFSNTRNMFNNHPWDLSTILVVIVLTIRILATYGLSGFMFKRFLEGNKKVLTVPFLSAIFFYLTATGKVFDLWRSIYFLSPIYDEQLLVNVLKWRETLLVFTFVPLLMLTLVPATMSLFTIRKKKSVEGSALFVIIYLITFSVWSFSIETLAGMGVIVTILSLLVYILVAWLFWFIHINQKMPQINSKMLAVLFLVYLGVSSLRPTLGLFMVQEDFTIIEETLYFIMYILFAVGLTKPAPYATVNSSI
ncbi:MAG: hypothetical protein R6U96_19320 [Promethearchaeia archaeon]